VSHTAGTGTIQYCTIEAFPVVFEYRVLSVQPF
jgi:hypothetical protein